MNKIIGGLLTVIVVLVSVNSRAQELDPNKKYAVACVGFYNLENLFDTIVDPDTNKILQDDFTPKSEKAWNTDKYNKKMANLDEVLSKIGVSSSNPDGAMVLGVSEIENRLVLEDLVKQPKIKDRNYQIVHFDSPDKRGIDVGLLYQPKYFTVTSTKTYRLKIPEKENFYTRDQLLVSGKLNGEEMHFIVCHWPSRRGGEKRSRPMRVAAGELARSIVDSLTKVDPMAKVIVMGDLNDDPINASVREGLHGVGRIDKLKDGDMYNPMEPLYKKGIGTLGYKEAWNLFDQMILTQGFLSLDNSFTSYSYFVAKVFNAEFLKQKEGQYEGYPLRTYSFGKFVNGYSDHFPVYLYLVKELK